MRTLELSPTLQEAFAADGDVEVLVNGKTVTGAKRGKDEDGNPVVHLEVAEG